MSFPAHLDGQSFASIHACDHRSYINLFNRALWTADCFAESRVGLELCNRDKPPDLPVDPD